MSYNVLSRITGRRENHEIDMPIIEWGGNGIFGYGLWNWWGVPYPPEDYVFSDDEFKTWHKIPRINLRPDVSHIQGVLNFGKGRIAIVYWENGIGSGIYSSVDGGKTFALNLLVAPNASVYNVSGHTSGDAGAFAFLDDNWRGGLVTTRDGGKTWEQVTSSIDDAYSVPVYVTSNEDIVVFNNAMLTPAGDLDPINTPEEIQGKEEDWMLTECAVGILLHPIYCYGAEKAFMFSLDLSTWQEVNFSESICEEMAEWPIAYSKKTGLAYQAKCVWMDVFEGEHSHGYTFVYIYSSTNLTDWHYVSRIQVQDYFTASGGGWPIKNVFPDIKIIDDEFVITGRCIDQDGFWLESLVAASLDGKDWTVSYVPVEVYAVS